MLVHLRESSSGPSHFPHPFVPRPCCVTLPCTITPLACTPSPALALPSAHRFACCLRAVCTVCTPSVCPARSLLTCAAHPSLTQPPPALPSTLPLPLPASFPLALSPSVTLSSLWPPHSVPATISPPGVSWIMVLSAINFLYCADSSYSEEVLQVDMCLCLLPETLHLAVNIINHFHSTCVVSLAKLQLVGITCVFLRSWHLL